MKRKGRKARIVVMAPMVSGPTMARAPEMAASSAPFPLSRSAAMLSPTTTASSTTMPTSRKKPKIVPRLSVRSAASKNISAPTKDKGMPTVIHNAMRSSKTRTREMNTRMMPIAPVLHDL